MSSKRGHQKFLCLRPSGRRKEGTTMKNVENVKAQAAAKAAAIAKAAAAKAAEKAITPQDTVSFVLTFPASYAGRWELKQELVECLKIAVDAGKASPARKDGALPPSFVESVLRLGIEALYQEILE